MKRASSPFPAEFSGMAYFPLPIPAETSYAECRRFSDSFPGNAVFMANPACPVMKEPIPIQQWLPAGPLRDMGEKYVSQLPDVAQNPIGPESLMHQSEHSWSEYLVAYSLLYPGVVIILALLGGLGLGAGDRAAAAHHLLAVLRPLAAAVVWTAGHGPAAAPAVRGGHGGGAAVTAAAGRLGRTGLGGRPPAGPGGELLRGHGVAPWGFVPINLTHEYAPFTGPAQEDPPPSPGPESGAGTGTDCPPGCTPVYAPGRFAATGRGGTSPKNGTGAKNHSRRM